MSSKKPQPLFDRGARASCPVCGKTSYSAAGIHPQCAARKADNERMRRVRECQADGQTGLSTPRNDTSPWQRVCPICSMTQAVRRKNCACGHTFDTQPRPPAAEGEAN